MLKFLKQNPQETEIVPARDGKIGVFIHQHLPLISWGIALQILSPQYKLLCAQVPTLVGPQASFKQQTQMLEMEAVITLPEVSIAFEVNSGINSGDMSRALYLLSWSKGQLTRM